MEGNAEVNSNSASVISWRLGDLESATKQLEDRLGKMQDEVTSLKVSFMEQFNSLRRDLFETPPFISRAEFETKMRDRDKELEEIRKDVLTVEKNLEKKSDSGISNIKYYGTVIVGILGFILSPIINDYLGTFR